MPKIDARPHGRFLEEQFADAELRSGYDQAAAQIAQVDEVMATLDRLRIEAGRSEADLARRIGKDPAAIRRLFTAEVNPELRTLAALAAVLDAEIRVVPRTDGQSPKAAAAAP